MRIPFDAVSLGIILEEIGKYRGGKLQRVTQPDASTLVLELYGGADLGAASLLLSCHADFYRIHFVTLRYPNQTQPPTFCATIRARLSGQRLVDAIQINGDRIAKLEFEDGHRIMVELMGKHSNLMLVDPVGALVAAAKWVGPSRSSRPVQSGELYALPPVLGETGRLSPFATKLVAAGGTVSGPSAAIISPGNGAYGYSVAPLGLPESPRSSLSIALEQHFDSAVLLTESDAIRTNLLTNLDRVILAREVAVTDLHAAESDSKKARIYQEQAELILAYGQHLPPQSTELMAVGYDGSEVRLLLDPDLDFRANADFYFNKAKRAKGRIAFVKEQIERLSMELSDVKLLRDKVAESESSSNLESLRDIARARHWLNEQVHHEAPKDRPFGGNRIRELIGPGGARVLYGETAEANDYLTQRVAKPNDIWLHVRGNRSAHVVIQTGNQPDRVGIEVLKFAAQVAARNSAAKHSGLVAVDWTLKKYVRKPKGSPTGSVTYTLEKTVHVEGGA